MSKDVHLSIVHPDPQDQRLHIALQQALSPPPLPADFRNRVMARVLEEQLQHVEARRAALELEHAKEMQKFRRGHVLLQRDTLLLITASAFAAGTCANLAVPWLQATFQLDSAVTVPVIALVIGLATGANAWIERFGEPGKLLGVSAD